VSRARASIRSWARDYGYRVESSTLEAAFSDRYRDGSRIAEVVYRVVFASETEGRHEAYALLWNVLIGRVEIVIQWKDRRGDETPR